LVIFEFVQERLGYTQGKVIHTSMYENIATAL